MMTPEIYNQCFQMFATKMAENDKNGWKLYIVSKKLVTGMVEMVEGIENTDNVSVWFTIGVLNLNNESITCACSNIWMVSSSLEKCRKTWNSEENFGF